MTLTEILEQARTAPAHMVLEVDRDAKTVTLYLDTKTDTYGEWIPGEGGDICLLRCRTTKKVMGVVLPLYVDMLAVYHDKPIAINGGFETLESYMAKNAHSVAHHTLESEST